MLLSPCIEWQFAAEYPNFVERIHAAKAAGFEAVEFHLWRDKDIAGIAAAIAATGVRITGICGDPRRSLVDPAQHGELLEAIRETIPVAQQLGNAPMIIASGFTREAVSQAEHFEAALAGLKAAAALAKDAQAMLVLEPLNDRVEHPGMWLVSTTRGLDLIEAVDSPHLRLLFDVYHSATMGEDLEVVLAGRMQLVHHVQIADQPGRNEPGTGTLDWVSVIATLRRLGYEGALGLEYRPTLPTLESLEKTRAALGL
jgi:hydroxypyruvate isomerase